MNTLNNTLEIGQKLEAMFLKHYKEWCLLSYSYTRNMAESEDVVQDVFIKILNRKQQNEIKDLKNYISISVRNTTLKKIQRTKRLEEINDDILPSSAPSYEEYLIDVENKAKVQEAVEVLPIKSKKVFELCVLEGIKYQSAAEVLGISINTVKFHLKKAFKILRFELQDAFL